MPPAPQVQGSRAGLITSLVASIIIAVAMIVVSFYGFQKLGESERALQDLREKDKSLVADVDYSDPHVGVLNALKDPTTGQPPFTGLQSAFQVSMAESDQLARLIGGNNPPDKTADLARAALKDADKRIDDLNKKKLVSFTLPKDTLTGALAALTDQVAQLAASNKDANDKLAAAQKQNQEIVAAQKGQLEAKDKLIQDANAKADQAATEAKQYQQQATDAQAALQASATQGQKGLQDANAALTSQIQAKDKQHLADIKTIAALRTKLRQARPVPTEAIVQRADGNIIRVSDYKTVFINLGERQHVTKGLTFEIYDKNRGIPALGNGLEENGLPIGKASIEVFKVGPDTSEARIIKVQPGQEIVIGDLIANLVYDPNTPYNFVVFGAFDLANSGTPTPGDADIIKRLITQWGGKIQPNVDVNTDFVVMGSEPQVPPIADPNDPISVRNHDQAVTAQKAYQAVINLANQNGVPVMNQNRFLYFTGYYDQATR